MKRKEMADEWSLYGQRLFIFLLLSFLPIELLLFWAFLIPLYPEYGLNLVLIGIFLSILIFAINFALMSKYTYHAWKRIIDLYLAKSIVVGLASGSLFTIIMYLTTPSLNASIVIILLPIMLITAFSLIAFICFMFWYAGYEIMKEAEFFMGLSPMSWFYRTLDAGDEDKYVMPEIEKNRKDGKSKEIDNRIYAEFMNKK